MRSRKSPGSASSIRASRCSRCWRRRRVGVVGLAHYLYHRSTTRAEGTCYLQDLFTSPEARGQGVARALIERVCEEARLAGIKRVYWQTHVSNAAGRLLYDKVAKHAGFIVYSRDL